MQDRLDFIFIIYFITLVRKELVFPINLVAGLPLTIVYTLLSISLLFSTLYSSFFLSPTRISVSKSSLLSTISSSIRTRLSKSLLVFLFLFFLLSNIIGNIPLNSIPTLYYSLTLTISLLFWLPLIICVSITQFKEFMSHILPYGSPVGLILFLPLVEIFSQLIRPFTLIIRLRTNLSSGHIIIYMFSYFTLLSSVLSPFIYIVLSLLFVLELCISALQAYIFVSLIALYIDETL